MSGRWTWASGRCGRDHDITLPDAIYASPDGRKRCAICKDIGNSTRDRTDRAIANSVPDPDDYSHPLSDVRSAS